MQWVWFPSYDDITHCQLPQFHTDPWLVAYGATYHVGLSWPHPTLNWLLIRQGDGFDSSSWVWIEFPQPKLNSNWTPNIFNKIYYLLLNDLNWF